MKVPVKAHANAFGMMLDGASAKAMARQSLQKWLWRLAIITDPSSVVSDGCIPPVACTSAFREILEDHVSAPLLNL